jgi:hypothetical protein
MEKAVVFDNKFYSKLKEFFSTGNRGTGRTSALAKIMFQLAVETEQKIKLVDHAYLLHGQHANDELWNKVYQLIRMAKAQGLNIEYPYSSRRNYSVQIIMQHVDYYKFINSYEFINYGKQDLTLFSVADSNGTITDNLLLLLL